jgi:hypothetical protein
LKLSNCGVNCGFPIIKLKTIGINNKNNNNNNKNIANSKGKSFESSVELRKSCVKLC